MLSYFLSTPVYNVPQLYYAGVAYMSDAPVTIPLILQEYKVVTASEKTTTIVGIPQFNPASNFAVGGVNAGYGVGELPKMVMSGVIETPTEDVNGYRYFAVKRSGPGAQRVSYPEIILAYMEGRGTLSYDTVDPTYFLDPYGRITTNPRAIEFTATAVAGRPGRHTFNLTLQATQGWYT